MSVRGLPKGKFRTDGAGVASGPPTFSWQASGGSTGKTITISSMAADEFTIIVAGASSNSYMYSIGYNEPDLEVKTLTIGHNGNGWESVHCAYVEPLPGDEDTHGTGVNCAFGSNDNPAWCYAKFKKLTGFKGDLIAAQRININSQTANATFTPFTNPMTEPGGMCIVGAFKDFTNYPTSVSGTGWNAGGWGGLTIQAYYHLSTTEVETPGNVTLQSSGGNHYWAGFCLYLR